MEPPQGIEEWKAAYIALANNKRFLEQVEHLAYLMLQDCAHARDTVNGRQPNDAVFTYEDMQRFAFQRVLTMLDPEEIKRTVESRAETMMADDGEKG